MKTAGCTQCDFNGFIMLANGPCACPTCNPRMAEAQAKWERTHPTAEAKMIEQEKTIVRLSRRVNALTSELAGAKNQLAYVVEAADRNGINLVKPMGRPPGRE